MRRSLVAASLVAAMAACAALSWVMSADARARHVVHRHQRTEENRLVTSGGHSGYPTQFRIPANPAVWDCVHVLFPQCDGRGGLNDGSFR